MPDFMKWLYAHYIKPELDDLPREEYEMWYDRMENDLEYYLQEAQEKILEHACAQALLLGGHTGAGLSGALAR